jgi:signal transduction histidine kinase
MDELTAARHDPFAEFWALPRARDASGRPLISRRITRFSGAEHRVRTASLAPADVGPLAEIYAYLLRLAAVLRPVYARPEEVSAALAAFLQTDPWTPRIALLQRLGLETLRESSTTALRGAFHDLRGGALQALSMQLQLAEAGLSEHRDAQQVFFLCRDHLKIMRNCISDLDQTRSEQDSLQLEHSSALLAEKWADAPFRQKDRSQVEVVLQARWQGVICESCLEFSTLDRIIYNLMNNAVHYSADGRVYFGFETVAGPPPENVRFLFANRCAPAHRALLVERFGDRPVDLLRGGFTTGGHGLGTRIAADFSAQAYGFTDFDEAAEAGVFGADLAGDALVIWFHWPVAD